MSITLDGSSLTIEKLVRIARDREAVELDAAGPGTHPRMPRHARREDRGARDHVRHQHRHRRVLRGRAHRRAGQLFQRALVYNHAAGIGEPAPQEVVRGAMAGRINVHAHGNSGIRPEITQTLVAMLNERRHAGRLPEGLGGRLRRPRPHGPARAARSWARASRSTRASASPPGSPWSAPASPIPGLQARDGLGTINGANVLTAMSALLLYDADALAAPGRDRLRHEPRGPAGQPQALRHPPARAARLPRRRAQRGRHHAPASRAPTWPPARSRPRCRTPTPCAPRRR